MIADIHGKPCHIGSWQELHETQSREEFLIGEPTLLSDNNPPDIGGDASSETGEPDEQEEAG
jgi:hypothetical protein